jgi:hemin uptake protein HemP
MEQKSPSMTLDGVGHHQPRAGRHDTIAAPAERQALHAPAPSSDPVFLDSVALLQGHNTVAIVHRGTIYRLQATRQGKLILTK